MQRPVQADLALQAPEGVHLNMPDSVYFDVDAIGSSDMKTLYWDPPTWWAQSDNNPNRRAPRRVARRTGKDTGTALHTLVIQGEAAYRAAYAIEPDDARSDWARTRDDYRRILRDKGVEIPRGDFSDRTVWALLRHHGLAHKAFDVARADYEAARSAGRMHLSEDEVRRLRFTAHLIRSHKELGPALTDGIGEMAVFWRRPDDPDTLLRAKFDYIRRRRMFDLKKIGNSRGRDVDSAIRNAIEDYDYDIQRRLYPEGWEAVERFVAEGKVYAWAADGGRASVLKDDRAQLETIVAAGYPEWVWIFVQLPVDDIGQERGAVVAPRWHKPEGAIWEAGGHKIETALRNYREFRTGFGLNRPWAVIEEAKELVDSDIRMRMKREMV